MSILRNAILGLASLAVLGGAATAASAQTRVEPAPVRHAQVVHRIERQEHRIAVVRHENRISRLQAHRLLVRERLAREHRLAHRLHG